jgi:isochorismate hydrolase
MDLPALLIIDMVKDNFKEEDYWLPKPRFSAFFNTDLETWLHDRKVTLCVVAGIATPFCVLTTALGDEKGPNLYNILPLKYHLNI